MFLSLISVNTKPIVLAQSTHKILVAVLWFTILFSTASHARFDKFVKADINTFGRFYQLEVGDNLKLDVFVPENTQAKRLPVLYLMDGQHYMFNAIGFQQTLTPGIHTMRASPDFIVVGINTSSLVDNSKSQRAQMLNSRAKQLATTVVERIIPAINSKFSTSGQNLFFGWQFGASFGLSLFNYYPTTFNGYLLASGPYYSSEQIAQTKTTLSNNPELDVKFYLSLGEQEKHALPGHNGLIKVFKSVNSPTVSWNYHYHDNYSGHIDHFTTAFDALSRGLAWHFNDFNDLTFYSLQDVSDFGGAKAVADYFKRRGQKYGIEGTVGEVAQFTMFRYAVEENDYQAFKEFERYLGSYKVNNRFIKYARFFAEHGDTERAISVLTKGITQHPEAHQLSAELARVYLIAEKRALAHEHFQHALGKAQGDKAASEQYQAELNKLL